ncbi:glycosyl transferase 2 family protein [Ochrobactrum quorumnocens]|uniref:Glycosyl transferase 2 family protein n=1 Tax=Ochrobactrum quorumnocens TaxID=271865 RepID=A0A248UCG9_9HYPH|nr:methyltransferase domain-containing protein [[Ochrobactrum] quorumnocens]ASV84513.1 glycosyl transferase 2 family protein [[Ochrobactrum] quorumnocens]
MSNVEINEFHMPISYKERLENDYFDDRSFLSKIVVHQPEIYYAADFIFRQTERSIIVDIGSGNGKKLASIGSTAKKKYAIDFGVNVAFFKEHYPECVTFDLDLENSNRNQLPKIDWKASVVICADVIEHLRSPLGLIDCLKHIYDSGGIIVLSTPDREKLHGYLHDGPPVNPAHVREWTLSELSALFAAHSMKPAFAGYSISDNMKRKKYNSVIILDRAINRNCEDLSISPLGIVSCFNDSDIIEQLSRKHLDSGIDLHFLDNWSNDGTFEILQNLQVEYPSRVTLERFPSEPTTEYVWRAILTRKAEIGFGFMGRWIIHIDSDELRTSPWSDISLSRGLAIAQEYGSSAVEFGVVEYPPLDDDFCGKIDPVEHFTHCYFSKQPSHFLQTKAWLQGSHLIDLSSTGGHHAQFPGKRVFPYRFILDHFPIRSTQHGLKKVLKDRKPRFSQQEVNDLGWHTHYDIVSDGYRFLSLKEFHIEHGADFLVNNVLEIVTDVVLQRMQGRLVFPSNNDF